MPCYHPQTVWRARSGPNPRNGAWPIVFNKREGLPHKELVIPCGQCIGCRLERARQWAIRCVHEKQMHDRNCFITLTYEDKYLIENRSLVRRDFVLFMKRLRKHYSRDILYENLGFNFKGHRIRFIMCGEYGDNFNRPHFHACLFGHDFPDKVKWKKEPWGWLYRSDELREIWPYGFNTIGEVNFESAAYLARYITKKVTGPQAEKFYNGREPEYVTMSRRPGIGNKWLEKYESDVYNYDEVTIRGGIKCRPPRYYDKVYGEVNKEKIDLLKADRIKRAKAKKYTYVDLERKEKWQKSVLKFNKNREFKKIV